MKWVILFVVVVSTISVYMDSEIIPLIILFALPIAVIIDIALLFRRR